ncbi:exosortase V [Glacieibacterium frigidum]|uniref:Exosortase n=1 Tax=Glacieibacterium frigidum TaxID=2593303 RepID=A0A552UIC0_9SPHN|nr:exosortase V [Glacieibacterium frigidum]TRW17964.1 exosortase [Glacieibacterium frigidum]
MATLASSPPAVRWPQVAARHWVLLLGLAGVIIPSILSLGAGPWSEESGVHGPLVVATGIWLVIRRMPQIRALAEPGSLPLALGVLVPAILLYIFGRAYDFISVEIGALLLALLAVAYAYVGPKVLRLMWFPIFYLGFVIPLPGWVLDQVTAPLKLFVSEFVTGGLSLAGYPIARVGVTIYVAQYQLLVEDACAGLNSLISLAAIGLFYVYILRNTNWRYAMLLLALVIPIAILANCVRVTMLVLLTYYYGDAVAQGFLHEFAGMVTFTSALLFLFLVDALLTPVRNWLARPGDEAMT